MQRVVWVQLLGCYAVGVIIRFNRAQICRGNGSGSREHCKRVARVGNSAQACRAPVPQSWVFIALARAMQTNVLHTPGVAKHCLGTAAGALYV